jgi:hypothetical protein
MQVFIEEALDLVLVDISHFFWRNSNHIAVLVLSLGGKLIDIFDIRYPVVDDSELRKVFFGDFSTRIVEFTLVNVLAEISALEDGGVVQGFKERGNCTLTLSYQYARIMTVRGLAVWERDEDCNAEGEELRDMGIGFIACTDNTVRTGEILIRLPKRD